MIPPYIPQQVGQPIRLRSPILDSLATLYTAPQRLPLELILGKACKSTTAEVCLKAFAMQKEYVKEAPCEVI